MAVAPFLTNQGIPLLEAEIQAMKRTMKEQQKQINDLSLSNACVVQAHLLLRETYADLDVQHRALCDCLHKSGLLHRSDLLAHWQAHQQRSALADLLDEPQAVRGLLLNSDVCTVRRLSAASKACLGNVMSSLSDLAAEGSAKGGFWLNRQAPLRQAAMPAAGAGTDGRVEENSGEREQPSSARQLPGPAISCEGPPAAKPLQAELSSAAEQLAGPASPHANGDSAASSAVMPAAGAGTDGRVEENSGGREQPSSAQQLPGPIISYEEPPAAKPFQAELSSAADQLAGPVSPHVNGDSTAMDPAFVAEFLQAMWHYFSLADALTCAMSAHSVRQFRMASRGCCECMRMAATPRLQRRLCSAQGRPGTCRDLWKPAWDLPGSLESGCLALLQEAWRDSHLAEILAHAMGSSAIKHFRAVSWATRECMRSCTSDATEDTRVPPPKGERGHRPVCGQAFGNDEAHAEESDGSGTFPELSEDWQPVGVDTVKRLLATCLPKPPKAQGPPPPSAGRVDSLAQLYRGVASQASSGPPGGPRTWVELCKRKIELAQARSSHEPELDQGSLSSRSSSSSSTSQELARQAARHRRELSDDLVWRVSKQRSELDRGDTVQLFGLKNRTELNGLRGKLLAFLVDIGRWHIRLDNGEAVRMRSVNLRLMELVQREASLIPLREPPAKQQGAGRGRPWRSSKFSRLLELALPRVIRFCGLRARLSVAAASLDAADAVQLQGKVYVCGGTDGQQVWDSVERLDLASGLWSSSPPMSQKRTAAGQATLGGRLFVLGGAAEPEGASDADLLDTLSSVEHLDPVSGRWGVMPPMFQPRAFPMVAVLKDRRLYVCGGCLVEAMGSRSRVLKELSVPWRRSFDGWSTQQAKFLALSSMERFHPRRRQWHKMPSMCKARYAAVAVAVRGRLYVAGGAGDRELCDLEAFDPEAGGWSSLPAMEWSRAFSMNASMFGYLYVLGGVRSLRVLNAAERYDFRRREWETLPSMTVERCGACVQAVPSASRILVCGGVQGVWSPAHAAAHSVEAYSLSLGAWEVLEPLLVSRSFCSSACVGGQLYILGGCSTACGALAAPCSSPHSGGGSAAERAGQAAILTAVERVDLGKGTSSEVASMCLPRLGGVTARLPM